MKNTGIVFIHGAGLGSFIWQDMQQYLPYPVLAIDLPNRNNTTHANDALTLDDYTTSVIKKIESWHVDRFVIVAHSIGGCIGVKIAKHFGNRTSGFIGISAAIPENGGSYISVFSYPKRILLFLVMYFFGTKPPAKAIEKDLCNDLNPEQTKQVVQNFTPESKGLYLDKCGANLPFIEFLYIVCSEDHGFPVTIQHKIAHSLNAKNMVTLQSGHLPMMSKPKELAAVITGFISSLQT